MSRRFTTQLLNLYRSLYYLDMTKCGDKKDELVCVREKGHVGAHYEEGRDLGPALFNNGRARAFKVWETTPPKSKKGSK